jgi:hypothetical protein
MPAMPLEEVLRHVQRDLCPGAQPQTFGCGSPEAY